MSVGLINLYSTRNLGDAAIYEALTSMCPGGKGFGALPAGETGTEVTGLQQVSRLPACGAYVSVGGEIFNNARPNLITRRFLSNVAALSRHPSRTILFGQTLPRSCRGFSFSLLAAALRRLPAVVVRDCESLSRLQEAGVNARMSYDTAFTLRNTTSALAAASQCFDRLGLDPARTAIISLRGESPMYSASGQRVEGQLGGLAKRLLARGHQVAVVIQADGDASDTDRVMAERLAAAIPGLAVLDPFAPVADVPAWALYSGMLGIANIVVGVRYHAAVLRANSGRQPLVAHYSSKGEDLCRRLGLPGLSVCDSDSDEAVVLAERSSSSSFDPEPLAHDVRGHFESALHSTLFAGARRRAIGEPEAAR